eukprot:6196505-Pleurochrysis_carterae.AAC.1
MQARQRLASRWQIDAPVVARAEIMHEVKEEGSLPQRGGGVGEGAAAPSRVARIGRGERARPVV